MPPQYVPDYRRVAATIRERIRNGTLPPGAKLPTKRQLAEEFEVSTQVIEAATLVLKTEGLIYGRQGRGTYVSDPLPPQA